MVLGVSVGEEGEASGMVRYHLAWLSRVMDVTS